MRDFGFDTLCWFGVALGGVLIQRYDIIGVGLILFYLSIIVHNLPPKESEK